MGNQPASPVFFIVAAAVFLFFILPFIKLVWLSFLGEAGVTLKHYVSLFEEEKTWRILASTLIIVLGSTLLSVVLGFTTAWLIAYSDIRYKKILQILIILSFIIPSYIVSLAWAQLMSTNGILAQITSWKPWNMYSYGGIIIVMGLHHYPLVYLLTLSVLRKIPRDLEWASRVSGVGRWTTFKRITLPLSLPGLASGGLLAFLASLDNFGIPAFLGIPAQINVLSTAIYEEVVGFGPTAFARAASLSVILGVIALAGTWLQWKLLGNSKRQETVQEDYEPRFSLGKARNLVEWTMWGALGLTTLVPVCSMGITSLIKAYGLPARPENLTFKHYVFVLTESSKVQSAIQNSFYLAFVTTIICLFIGTAIAYWRVRKNSLWVRGLEIFIGLPYALPGVVFSLAIIFTWMEPIPGWNPGIYGSVTILFIAYTTRFMILQVRGSLTALLQVDPSMEEAAHVSGSSGIRKWKAILLPLMWPGVLGGAFLVMLTALTELTVSSLLWSSGSETIGVVVFNFEQAGSTSHSTALSSLIVLIIFISMIGQYVLRKFVKGRVKQL